MLIVVLFCLCAASPAFAEHADLVKIEKAERRMTLLSRTRILRTYQISLGSSPSGPKRCEGDSKTPEGIYRISGRNRGSAYHRSLRISYPNDNDRRRARERNCLPGGDIMIHGLPNGAGWLRSTHLARDWTLGCVAVTNDEIEEIWNLVPDGTKVEILP